MMTLAQAHALLPHSTVVGEGATTFLRVHSDTRTLRAGDPPGLWPGARPSNVLPHRNPIA